MTAFRVERVNWRLLKDHEVVNCQANVEVWQRMLKVRALVLTPRDNADIWIKFANLCRKSERVGLAERALASLGAVSDFASSNAVPLVAYARLKFNWATGNLFLSHGVSPC